MPGNRCRHRGHRPFCLPAAAGLDEDGSTARRAAGAADGAPAPFIAVQPFPALLDLPRGSDAVKASCGSRHTAVVTSEWGWVGCFGMEQGVTPPHAPAGGCARENTAGASSFPQQRAPRPPRHSSRGSPASVRHAGVSPAGLVIRRQALPGPATLTCELGGAGCRLARGTVTVFTVGPSHPRVIGPLLETRCPARRASR